jgi:elongation factor G
VVACTVRGGAPTDASPTDAAPADGTSGAGTHPDSAKQATAAAAFLESRHAIEGVRVKTFPTAKIRNVALVGHGGSGKTTLVEALCFTAGAIPRMGRVEDGNTVTDFDPEEQRRGISVSLAVAPVEFDDHKINLLDTPGYADFVGDVVAALHAADIAVFVVSAVEGVEVQTEIAWKLAEQRGLPRAVFVNKLDRERASFERTLDELKAKFGAGVAPLQLPIGQEGTLSGVIDLLNDVAITYDANGKGTEGPIPTEMEAEEHSVHDALVEGIVIADDDLMERYLADERLEYGELAKTLAAGVAQGSVFPVLCGSGSKLIGVDRLLKFLVEEAPAPSASASAGDGADAALVFKTIVDPYVGRVNLFKVLQGTVKHDEILANTRTKSDERLHQLSTLRGKEQETVNEVPAGDIAAVAKLTGTATGDVLATKGTQLDVEAFETPEPPLAIAIHPKSKGDEDKLATALHRLQDEDTVLRIERNAETHQTLLRGMGETHVSIALEKLARKFGVEVETEEVRVPYRETITGSAEAEGKLKKQTGGHGQFAVAWLRVEPLERGSGLEFDDKIVGGVIPRQYIPAVEKGIHETVEHGGALGFPVVDVKVTCFDGKHHPVDSSEMAFKTAASLGMKEALQKAGPMLLEPISELVIVVPEASQGDVMGDLNSKRGRIQGTAPIGNGEVEVSASVPTSEILRYAIDLRSMTGGRGRFTATFSHYDPVPSHLVDKIAAATKEAAAKS